MKKYSILHPLLLSFYSKDLYQDVGRNWRGTGFLYLLLLLALAWIPTMVQLHHSLGEWVDTTGRALAAQVPAITITNGRVSTEVETPYFITDPETGKLLAIVDLTGEHTSLEDSDAQALLTETTLILRENARGPQVHDLSGIQEFEMDAGTVEGLLDFAKGWLAVLFYPFAVLFSFLYRAVQLLLYAAVGVLLCGLLNTRLDYQVLLRLAAMAVTPGIVLDTLIGVAEVQVPFWWPISFGIAMVYLFYAVKANSEPSQPLAPAQPTP